MLNSSRMSKGVLIPYELIERRSWQQKYSFITSDIALVSLHVELLYSSFAKRKGRFH